MSPQRPNTDRLFKVFIYKTIHGVSSALQCLHPTFKLSKTKWRGVCPLMGKWGKECLKWHLISLCCKRNRKMFLVVRFSQWKYEVLLIRCHKHQLLLLSLQYSSLDSLQESLRFDSWFVCRRDFLSSTQKQAQKAEIYCYLLLSYLHNSKSCAKFETPKMVNCCRVLAV